MLALLAIAWSALKPDPQVEALNRALQQQGSNLLREYPYRFRAVRLEGETAVMTTPRSQTVPVFRMISALYPHLSGRSSTSPEFITAQQELAQVQGEARQIVLQQAGVSKVEWELDQSWLIQHNIPLN
ncbi:MAG: glutamate-ammonia-ligase adenylyltransferase [Gammaproteobacteria bacterium]|nr:glutamate-ammonia-ligase adenylyltransferase [Gammaproteobacteria bacterium]